MRILFNQTQLQQAVEKVAQEIHSRHYDNLNPPVFICVLNGAFMFFTDLVKEMNPFDIEIDFIRAKSYQNQNQFEVKITKDIELDLVGKNVYIVDDIYDSGKTMNFIIEHLYRNSDNEVRRHYESPNSITPVTLFKRKNSDCEGLIYGFELEDESWLHGYGLDGENGLYRNKKDIFGFLPEID